MLENQISSNLLYEIKPLFRCKKILVATLLATIIYTPFIAFAACFLLFFIGAILLLVFAPGSGNFEEMLLYLLNLAKELATLLFATSPLMMFAIIYFTIVTMMFLRNKISVSLITYRFYDDRIEHMYGFFSKSKSTLHYKDIIGLKYSQSPFQEKLNIGTIHLEAPGRSSLTISDIKQSQEMFKMLQHRTNRY